MIIGTEIDFNEELNCMETEVNLATISSKEPSVRIFKSEKDAYQFDNDDVKYEGYVFWSRSFLVSIMSHKVCPL